MRLALVASASLLALAPGCRPSGTKTSVGPLAAVRFDDKTPDGRPLACFVFGAESSRPARLCGEGGPIAGYEGASFVAVSPPPEGDFAKAGAALEPGDYLLRPLGENAVDAWSLGALTQKLWLGGGRLLLAIERGRRVRLVDPAARTDRTLALGPGKADAFLVAVAPDDKAVLLVQKNGGEELVLLRDPLGAGEVGVLDVTADDAQPGNLRMAALVARARAQGQVFQPQLAQLQWSGAEPTFEGSALGPFRAPAKK